MDDDGIIGRRTEYADLQRYAASGWPYDHDQIIALADGTHHVADRRPDVLVFDAVLAGWLPDPHVDNIWSRLPGTLSTEHARMP